MSKNLAQVFAANPITTIGNTDLLYVVTTGTTDAGINGSSLKALFASSTLTSANFYVGSAGNVATGVAMSGDAALANTGAVTVSKIGGVSISLAGSFTTSGAFASTFTMTNTTTVTFPTSGTLATVSQIPTGAALTKTDDTNVTLTLGGSAATALVNAASLTLGWTGTLSGTRGGTGVNNGASTITLGGSLVTSGAFASTFTMTNTTSVTFPTSGTLATTSQIPTGAALTKTDDTNVTLTLGGSPSTALVNAASLTLGWTGTLSGTRGGTGVNNGASTITLGGSLTTSGAFASTFTMTNTTSVTFPTSGTLATTSQVITNVNQASSSATLAANNRYATNNGASLVTYTIPAGAAVGDTYIIVGGSSGGWTVAQPASVTVHLGSSATTTGATGTLSSSNQYDCVTITCVASNVFTAYGVQGNLTVV